MTSNGISKSSDTPDNEWGEAELLSALDRLQNIHIQLRKLREAMAQVVHPLLIAQSSPETLYAQFSHVAMTASNDVQEFAKLVECHQSQEILTKANGSRAENSEGIKGWMVTEHPDWLEMKSRLTHLDPAGQPENTPAKVDSL